ncbi:hypothetical protein FsymDg_0188 [Candidatus Protofrankia datiscae]|uniref:Uncharacterized protein n=2 Tax=Candidatus Protofrankia datiscae TaxID=2716812 RepID=F8B2P0_9ACTN|nr:MULTISPECIES: helix-turn-helix domain-containing protein [Protofrankia]AEH07760.1 hypothetical protein FsymDg_0188 [Candidatus Protofrankia datiscae]
MADNTRVPDAKGSAGRQLAIPGVLVLMPTPDSGTPVADPSAWQRAVLRSRLPRAAKLVALALASHCGVRVGEPVVPGLDESIAVCSPGLVTLASETGYSRTHVQRQIRLLRDLGWLLGLSRPAVRRPASFALTMSGQVRTGTPAAATAVATVAAAGTSVAADSAAAASTAAPYPAGQRADVMPAAVTPRRRRAGLRPASDRPSAAARRRARITGAAMAKALMVVGDNSVVTASVPAGSFSAAVSPVPPPTSMTASPSVTRSGAVSAVDTSSTAGAGAAGSAQPEFPESAQSGNVHSETEQPPASGQSGTAPDEAVAPDGVIPVIGSQPAGIASDGIAPGAAVWAGAAPADGSGQAPVGSSPAQPVSPRRLVAEAAEQVVATLARAIRRDPQTLAVARDRIVHILAAGLWNAAELAMHLVDTVGSSAGAGRVDDPVDHVLRRLDHLPASSAECLCRSCRSWAPAPVAADHRASPAAPAAAAPAQAPSPVAMPRQVPSGLPELAAIEQAAAAGAAQARTRPHRATGAA